MNNKQIEQDLRGISKKVNNILTWIVIISAFAIAGVIIGFMNIIEISQMPHYECSNVTSFEEVPCPDYVYWCAVNSNECNIEKKCYENKTREVCYIE